jgi:DNA polymerase-3 subunit epsilon
VCDARTYSIAVDAAARAFGGDPTIVVEHLEARMVELAATQRYEEAAMVRDRLSALLGAVRRDRLVHALRAAGRVVVRRGDASWTVDDGRLVDVTMTGTAGRALPVDPPDPPSPGRPLSRSHVDEAMCLARYFDQHATRLHVESCTGSWLFPVDAVAEVTRLRRRGA